MFSLGISEALHVRRRNGDCTEGDEAVISVTAYRMAKWSYAQEPHNHCFWARNTVPSSAPVLVAIARQPRPATRAVGLPRYRPVCVGVRGGSPCGGLQASAAFAYRKRAPECGHRYRPEVRRFDFRHDAVATPACFGSQIVLPAQQQSLA